MSEKAKKTSLLRFKPSISAKKLDQEFLCLLSSTQDTNRKAIEIF